MINICVCYFLDRCFCPLLHLLLGWEVDGTIPKGGGDKGGVIHHAIGAAPSDGIH